MEISVDDGGVHEDARRLAYSSSNCDTRGAEEYRLATKGRACRAEGNITLRTACASCGKKAIFATCAACHEAGWRPERFIARGDLRLSLAHRGTR